MQTRIDTYCLCKRNALWWLIGSLRASTLETFVDSLHWSWNPETFKWSQQDSQAWNSSMLKRAFQTFPWNFNFPMLWCRKVEKTWLSNCRAPKWSTWTPCHCHCQVGSAGTRGSLSSGAWDQRPRRNWERCWCDRNCESKWVHESQWDTLSH